MRKSKTGLGRTKALAAACLLSTAPIPNSANASPAAPIAPPSAVENALERSRMNPSAAPDLVMETAELLRRSLSPEDFKTALSGMLSSLSREIPSVLPQVLARIAKKYPDLAVDLACACVSANRGLAEEIIAAVLEAVPSIDQKELASAMASSAGIPQGSFDYIFAGFSPSAVPFPGFGLGGGSGGGPIYGE